MTMRWGMVALCVALMALAGCNVLFGSSYRYRLTVEVETPQGLRSASSVIQIRSTQGSGIPNNDLRVSIRGQAIAVDMPDGKTLFALLSSDASSQAAAGFAFAALMPVLEVKGGDSEAYFANEKLLKKKKQVGELPRAIYPTFVTFTDISNPRTVAKVNPADLSPYFGPGTRIRQMTVQITDDPVTTGISRRFPWWDEYVDKHFDGSPANFEDFRKSEIAAHLYSLSFGRR